MPMPCHAKPLASKSAGHYRRFKDYDYSRGAAIFITFAVAGRTKVFGSVDENGRLRYSSAGMSALSTLSIEPRQFADGRLLLLSRIAAPGSSRYDAWHGINDALADFATSTAGGLSPYATSATDFQFSR